MRRDGHAAVLLLLGCLLLSLQGSSILAYNCPADEQNVWRALLQAALDKTPEDRELVERMAKDPPSEAVGSLAKVLLEEWTLPPTAEKLRRPRIVYASKPDFSDLVGSSIPPAKSSVVVATAEVTPLGHVQNVQLIIATEVEEIDERCLRAFKQWRYRPARGDHGYESSNAGATCHINLQ